MRQTFLAAFALACSCSCSCAKEPAPPARAPVAQSGAAALADSDPSGRVAEKIDASQYSYLRLETASGEVWAAVPKSRVEVGAQATIRGAMWMTEFKSATLSRTWARIAFGTLEGESPAAPSTGASTGASPQKESGHPAGMFAEEAAHAFPSQSPRAVPSQSPQALPPQSPHALPSVAVAAEPKLTRAAAPEGRTIAEVYAQRASLKDRTVVVRGRIVKEIDGVMGKSFLHLRDGSGSGPSADLAVSTDTAASVGDVVLMTGTVHLDRDLGAGYRYEILIEDAQIKKE